MEIGWSELTFSPDEEAVSTLVTSWAWLLPDAWTPLLFSVLGDVFLEKESGGVFWLNTGAGEITRIADDVAQFRAALGTEIATDWFMPPLVERLHEAGKIPGPGECYTYVIMPVFAEGKYEVDNLNVVPAREHFSLSGTVHAQIRDLPDGDQVQIVFSRPH